jgi:GTP cyclohydrolase IA
MGRRKGPTLGSALRGMARQQAERERVMQLRINALSDLMGTLPYREHAGTCDTPVRAAQAWAEMTSGYGVDPRSVCTTFDGESYDQMVVLGPISFFSTCEHHLLPFHGHAWVGYVPKGPIIGLSKLARIVEIFARRLSVQERMTGEIAACLWELLQPLGVAVRVQGEHLCMKARGVEQQSAYMTTQALRGVFLGDAQTRAEFLALCRKEG